MCCGESCTRWCLRIPPVKGSFGRCHIPHPKPERELMRKIHLDPETLNVESFAATDEVPDVRGTVNAHAPTRNCPPATGMTFCETNCDCTFGCPTMVLCTEPIG